MKKNKNLRTLKKSGLLEHLKKEQNSVILAKAGIHLLLRYNKHEIEFTTLKESTITLFLSFFRGLNMSFLSPIKRWIPGQARNDKARFFLLMSKHYIFRGRNLKKLFYIFIPLILFLIYAPQPSLNAQQLNKPTRILGDFYPIHRSSLEMGWQHVAGFNGQNIEYIRTLAKRYNFHPADVAAILIADSACRFAWPGGLPNEIPIGFMQSPTGISQIPPGMAASHRLMDARILVPGAQKRFHYMRNTILQPEKGVDYWFKSLAEESYEVMKDPRVNIRIATRYMRRVADAAIALYKPDAKESIKIDDRSLLPDQHIRWADEFDWGRLQNYMRNNMLWERSYEFNLTEFAPSFDQKSELNMMIFYSEYRTAPPFDGSWFFEAMYLMRETHRWLNSQERILKMLEPINEPAEVYFEYVEDYSFYQDEWDILNPGRIHPDDLPPLQVKNDSDSEDKDEDEKENDEEEIEDSEKSKKKKRKTRGKYE